MDFTRLSADLESQPITGYLHTGERLHVPLISHIVDNLYVGGCVHGVDLGDFFSDVFSLYKWERYSLDESTALHEWTMYDSRAGVEVSDEDGNILDINDIASQVVDALDKGGNVLVHCQAGINRSNLTATLALRQWKGLSSTEAIALLREKRSRLVLANRTFEDYLLALDKE